MLWPAGQHAAASLASDSNPSGQKHEAPHPALTEFLAATDAIVDQQAAVYYRLRNVTRVTESAQQDQLWLQGMFATYGGASAYLRRSSLVEPIEDGALFSSEPDGNPFLVTGHFVSFGDGGRQLVRRGRDVYEEPVGSEMFASYSPYVDFLDARKFLEVAGPVEDWARAVLPDTAPTSLSDLLGAHWKTVEIDTFSVSRAEAEPAAWIQFVGDGDGQGSFAFFVRAKDGQLQLNKAVVVRESRGLDGVTVPTSFIALTGGWGGVPAVESDVRAVETRELASVGDVEAAFLDGDFVRMHSNSGNLVVLHDGEAYEIDRELSSEADASTPNLLIVLALIAGVLLIGKALLATRKGNTHEN